MIDPVFPGPHKPARRRIPWSPFAVFFGLALLYGFTATRSIQGGDTAEFTLVAALGGVPHPPGYPLYVLLAQGFAQLPFGPLPFRVSLLSVVCGAAAAAMVTRLLRRLTGSPWAAVTGGLAFGLTPIAWRLSGVPEVFTLNVLLAALFIDRSLSLSEAVSTRRALLLGLVAGLGASNHHTIVLSAPLGIWALICVGRTKGLVSALRTAGLAIVGVAAGLLPYLSLLRAGRTAQPGDWIWGDLSSFRGLLRHFLRSEYGTFSLGLHADAPRPLATIGAFWGSVPTMFVGLLAVAGLWGLAAALRIRRGFALGLGAALILSGVVFLGVFNLPPGPLAEAVAARFHLLPLLFFSLFVGFGLSAVETRIPWRARYILSGGTLLVMGTLSYTEGVDWRRAPTVEKYLSALLVPAAPRAVFLGTGDAESFGLPYLTDAAHLRPDVRTIDVHLLRLPWYFERTRARVPEMKMPFDAQRTKMAALIEGFVSQSVPIYISAELAPSLAAFPMVPEGLAYRFLPPGVPPPPIAQVEASVDRATALLGPLADDDDEPWSQHVRALAAQSWLTLAGAYAREQRRADVIRCRARAAILDPRLITQRSM